MVGHPDDYGRLPVMTTNAEPSFTANVTISKYVPAGKANNNRGYADIDVPASHHDVASIELRSGSLEELKARIAAHVELVVE